MFEEANFFDLVKTPLKATTTTQVEGEGKNRKEIITITFTVPVVWYEEFDLKLVAIDAFNHVELKEKNILLNLKHYTLKKVLTTGKLLFLEKKGKEITKEQLQKWVNNFYGVLMHFGLPWITTDEMLITLELEGDADDLIEAYTSESIYFWYIQQRNEAKYAIELYTDEYEIIRHRDEDEEEEQQEYEDNEDDEDKTTHKAKAKPNTGLSKEKMAKKKDGFGVSLYTTKSLKLIKDEKKNEFYIDDWTPYFIEDLIGEVAQAELFEDCEKSLSHLTINHYSEDCFKTINAFKSKEDKENAMVRLFLKRFRDVKSLRKKLNIAWKPSDCENVLANLKHNFITEIDVHLAQLYETMGNHLFGLWVLKCACDEGLEVIKCFPEGLRYADVEKKLKEKFKLNRGKNQDENKDNKFLRNIFNQMQMLVNVRKAIFLNEKWEIFSKRSFEEFVSTLPKEIDLFIYNIGFNEGDTYLRAVNYEIINSIKSQIKSIQHNAMEQGFIKGKEYKQKFIYFVWDEEKQCLFMYLPFGANSNVGTFFECFKSRILSEALLKQYYKINGFKLIFGDKGKDTLNDVNPEEIKDAYGHNETNYTFFMEC